MMRSFLICLIMSFHYLYGQGIEYSDKRVDVEHYKIDIDLSKYDKHIVILEEIQFRKKSGIDTLVLDLYSLDTISGGYGMVMHKANSGSQKLNYFQSGHFLFLTGWNPESEYSSITLEFEGTPLDGLIISDNKFHDKTVFGDNWPNRAHHWMACNDYLSDKAKVSFRVTVPKEFQVIANGTLINEEKTASKTVYHYETSYELPTKVMVIGVADFEVMDYDKKYEAQCPVSAWVYPQEADKAFYDMALAPDILTWFEQKISPYPYDKLANVQSTTRYGGMENASCIFYDEKAIDGKRSMETLIAHEIAHQWFGNSASEKNFSHLWLSEGFATYLTNIYVLETKGEEAFYKQMEKDRAKVISFNKRAPLPVIDTLTRDLNQLLNANAYQKGSWVLHMLRMKLGDDVFWEGIKSYYRKYAFGNADSKDFEAVMENSCSCELTDFFNQWLKIGGNPKLKIAVRSKRNSATVRIQQESAILFNLPLEIDFISKDGTLTKKTLTVTDRETKIKVNLPGKMKSFTVDPERKLLVELSGN